MAQLETGASAAIVVMFLTCILGVGFMLRFLSAIAVEGRTMRARRIGAHRGGRHG